MLIKYYSNFTSNADSDTGGVTDHLRIDDTKEGVREEVG